jgi:deoxyribonuclease-4
MSTLRVRQILSNLNVNQKTALKKLLPPKLSVPSVETHKYPSALLGILPEDEIGKYAHLGILTEQLLRMPSAEITQSTLLEVLRGYLEDFSDEFERKIVKSVTTQPFLDCVKATRLELEKVLRSTAEEGALRYEEEVVCSTVSGHPDMWNTTQVFEVKTTGMLKDNWTSFLFQVFAYGAIMPSVKDVYLVLPLQKMVWHYNLAGWKTRTEYRDFLTSWSSTAQTDRVTAHLQASLLCATHEIGCHIGKAKTITDTIRQVAHSPAPYQIFLSGPQNSNIKADDRDLASALALVEESGARIFVHSQYLINLSNKETEDLWHEKLLIKNLQVCRAFGGQGVVVHVGKSVKLPKPEAIEQMRSAIGRCLEHATSECPLLLETPAGQGTELLTDMKEFLDFVESFATPKLRVCLDTCHVFASGHDPKAYLEACLARPGLLKLVHYNDSLGTCGSCVDRHAHIASGEGLIGFPKMSELAEICSANDIPMIIE